MNEREFSQVSPELEAALRTYYAGPAPSPAFVAQLEQELQARHPASAAPLHRRIRGAFAGLRRVPAWQLASLALLLLALLALFAIGPRRVLASAQRLLGYVPGMGFVDLDQSRVLAVPAAVSQDGVRLQIDELLAEPDRTRLRYSIQGLSTDDFYTGTEGAESNFEAYLLLPDDERLRATGWSGTVNGEISFPALPDGIGRPHLGAQPFAIRQAGGGP